MPGMTARAALCRASSLPLVSLRDVTVRHCQLARRPLCRPLAGNAACAAASATPLTEPAPKFASLPLEQQQQIDAFLDVLLDWNLRMNLVSRTVTDKGEAYERHVNDSLALLPAIDRCLAAQRQEQAAGRQPWHHMRQHLHADEEWERVGSAHTSSSGSRQDAEAGAVAAPKLIDVGSGAGLPGIILAIARPEWEVTLLDSLQKRCTFTEAAVEAVGLSNVRVHCGRAEDAGQDPALRQQHDVAIARAVAELRVLAELCLPLVRSGGHWVAAKGVGPMAEVAGAQSALSKLGGKLLGLEEVDSESPVGRRTAVVVLKTCPTPLHYPRRPGVPAKKPL